LVSRPYRTSARPFLVRPFCGRDCGMKRRNGINGQFAPRLIEMLESPAYRALSRSAHQVISRVEVELGHHGGNDNGRLPVTFADFVNYGVDRASVAAALREAEALGFLRVTHGRGGNAEYRSPNLFALTFTHNRETRSQPPSHDWRKISTIGEAITIARDARAAKDQSAIARGINSWQRHQRKQIADPGKSQISNLETGVETAKASTLETRVTAPPEKPGLLSISRGGGLADHLPPSTRPRRKSHA
jgi:hypothetical protein